MLDILTHIFVHDVYGPRIILLTATKQQSVNNNAETSADCKPIDLS